MRHVFIMAVGGDAKVDDSGSKGHTSETLELRLHGRTSELKLLLVEGLVPTVRASVEDLEPDLVARPAESRRDVGAVAAVVVAVDVAVAVVRAFDSDCEIGVRLEAVVWDCVQVFEHGGVGGEFKDKAACLAHPFHLLQAFLAGATVDAEDIGNV